MTPLLTPGAYLRRRREAAGLSIEDLAALVDTWPRTCARYRADLIAGIEADDVPISPGTAIVLRMAFCFDPLVLDQLAEIHAGSAVLPPQLCRVCACSWHDPCREAAPFGRCAWAQGDATLCTACIGKPEPIAPSADVVQIGAYRTKSEPAILGLDLARPGAPT